MSVVCLALCVFVLRTANYHSPGALTGDMADLLSVASTNA